MYLRHSLISKARGSTLKTLSQSASVLSSLLMVANSVGLDIQ